MSTDYVALHVHGQRPNSTASPERPTGWPPRSPTGRSRRRSPTTGLSPTTGAFAAAATSAGITPILGLEAYVAIGSRHEQNALQIPAEEDFDGDAGMAGATTTKRYTHLTLFARTRPGGGISSPGTTPRNEATGTSRGGISTSLADHLRA